MLKRYRSPSVIKKRRKRLLTRGAIIFGIASFVVGGLAGLSRLQAFQINSIEIKGVSSLPEDEIKQVVNSQIAGTYAFIFPKTNVFIYPKDKIEQQLNTDYKQIENLTVDSDGMHGIDVEITERRPYVLWCTDPQQVSDCFYVDKNGYIYSRAPYFSGHTFVKYSGLVTGNPIGSQFAAPEKIAAVEGFVKKLKSEGLQVTGIQLADKSEYTAYLKDGGTILFNDENGLDTVEENLETVLNQNGIKKEDIPKLDYINLRFDKKVFFKLKE